MRPSAIFRALSLQFPARISPCPVQSPFDKFLTPQLSALLCHDESYASANWLMDATDVAVATQRTTFANISILECNRELIEEYLDDDVELLDACNSLRGRIETVKKYIESLRTVLHCLQCLQGGSDVNLYMIAKVCKVLDSCAAMERRSAELEKCSSSLKKLGERLAQGQTPRGQLHEVLNGSKAVALFVCGVLGISLSFKTKRGLPAIATQSSKTAVWLCSLLELHKEVNDDIEKRRKSGSVVLVELRDTVNATKTLRDQINLCRETHHQVELGLNVEELRKTCNKLEESVKPLDARVDELYRNLVSTRMALLGVLSAA